MNARVMADAGIPTRGWTARLSGWRTRRRQATAPDAARAVADLGELDTQVLAQLSRAVALSEEASLGAVERIATLRAMESLGPAQ